MEMILRFWEQKLEIANIVLSTTTKHCFRVFDKLNTFTCWQSLHLDDNSSLQVVGPKHIVCYCSQIASRNYQMYEMYTNLLYLLLVAEQQHIFVFVFLWLLLCYWLFFKVIKNVEKNHFLFF